MWYKQRLQVNYIWLWALCSDTVLISFKHSYNWSMTGRQQLYLLDGATTAAATEHQQSSFVIIVVVTQAQSAGCLSRRWLKTRPQSIGGHEKAPRRHYRRRRRYCRCWRAEEAGWRCGRGGRSPAACLDRCDQSLCGHAEYHEVELDDSYAESVRHRLRVQLRHLTEDASRCHRTTAGDETCSATHTTHTRLLPLPNHSVTLLLRF